MGLVNLQIHRTLGHWTSAASAAQLSPCQVLKSAVGKHQRNVGDGPTVSTGPDEEMPRCRDTNDGSRTASNHTKPYRNTRLLRLQIPHHFPFFTSFNGPSRAFLRNSSWLRLRKLQRGHKNQAVLVQCWLFNLNCVTLCILMITKNS